MAIISTIAGTLDAWGERLFLPAIIASIVSEAAKWGGIAFSIWSGFKAGDWVESKSHGEALQWLIGVLAFLVTFSIIYFVFSNIPGVDWRFQALMSYTSHLDW